MLEFEWPWLAVCALLPLLTLLFKAKQQAPASALRVPDINALFQGQSAQSSSHTGRVLWVLSYLAYLSLVLACMRPTWVGETVELPLEGRDLMMAIDLSGSMRTGDMSLAGYRVSRLAATQKVATEFIEKRQGDRIGLIVFGEQAYIQTPLTFDLKTVEQHISESQIGFAGERATVIGDAIGLAIKRLKASDVEEKTLILLTDGVDTGSSIPPLKAAELAAQAELKIYTIGLGRRGSREIDENTLRQIAQLTGGQYFRATSTRDLNEIYQYIDQLEPVESDSASFKPVTALYQWPLALALLSGLLAFLLKLYRGGSV